MCFQHSNSTFPVCLAAGVRDRGRPAAVLLPGRLPVDDDGGGAHRPHARAGLRQLKVKVAVLLRCCLW